MLRSLMNRVILSRVILSRATLTRATLLLGSLFAGSAVAADACPTLRNQQSAPDIATRIAAVACSEHMLWYRPFIDAQGRLASVTVAEAENTRLDDGGTPAWLRVASYWRDSGLLPRMAAFDGSNDCTYAGANRYSTVQCRGFVVDQPWSAAFISYVLRRAGLPGFNGSPSHVDYVRDALTRPGESAYEYRDPASTRPATGDMLCYVRSPNRVFGFEGLRQELGSSNGGLPMHCEIFVATNPGGDGLAYLIGGNVQHGVTMRLMPVNRSGLLWSLPRRAQVDPECAPDTASACNFNRQDWAVLLKLKPATVLATLAPPPPFQPASMAPPGPACCVNCVVGAVPPVPRCPNPNAPAVRPTQGGGGGGR